MSNDNLTSDVSLAKQLVKQQFPHWTKLPIKAVESGGTDNNIFRLGAHICLRLPRRPDAIAQVAREQEFLPRFNNLPLQVPQPLALGKPTNAYTSPWTICNWIDGQEAHLDNIDNVNDMAQQLAQFLTALHQVNIDGAPLASEDTGNRGVDLSLKHLGTSKAINGVSNEYDAKILTKIWQQARDQPKWQSAPVWLHGDIKPDNLIAKNGQLAAVIDFGLMAVGDPAVDLMLAWSVLPPTARAIFKAILQTDENTWARGRGWALSVSLIALDYYKVSNVKLANLSRHTINQVIKEYKNES